MPDTLEKALIDDFENDSEISKRSQSVMEAYTFLTTTHPIKLWKQRAKLLELPTIRSFVFFVLVVPHTVEL
jgi:hypothetical protein